MPRHDPHKQLIMYSRAGCHLCEHMLADVYNTFGEDLNVEIIDVDTDPALQEAYGVRVPVLVGSYGELCHYHLDENAVQNYLEQVS